MNPAAMQPLLVSLTVCLLAWVTPLFSAESPAASIHGRIVSVSDGDTLTVLDGENRQHKIRVAGIDAPERKQPFGQRSKSGLSDCSFGKTVEIVGDKRDKYGRTVGKVIADSRDCGLAQVNAGLAWHYKAYEREQPKADREAYSQSEDAARKAGIGLWSEPSPVPPWQWRKGRR
jgi:endonuclease YncB( thermonuclease family)